MRLDSGDLIALSKSVRRILDEGGLGEVSIFASGGLDEDSIAAMLQAGAPIDGFGIGTSLTTSSDVPALDCAYKLQEYAGLAAAQALHRQGDLAGAQAGVAPIWAATAEWPAMSCRSRATDQSGEPLIQLVMQGGRRIAPSPTLAESRARAARDLARLPEPLRRLEPQRSYPVQVADALVRLADEVDSRLAPHDRVPA